MNWKRFWTGLIFCFFINNIAALVKNPETTTMNGLITFASAIGYCVCRAYEAK